MENTTNVRDPDRKTTREQVTEILDQLEKGVSELFESDRFKEYLTCMSKFHNYSFNNTLLIAMQKPDATLVAGFNAWKDKHGRMVKKGEKGIRILAPYKYKVETMPENEGEESATIERTGFKPTYVFDVSQTEGKPLPTIGVDELTGDVQQYEIFFDALKKACPVPIGFEQISSGAKGYYHTVDKEIVIQQGMSESQTLKTLVHEVSHARLHDRDAMKAEGVMKSQQQKELEAESIAYTVLCHYHLDTSGYSIPYLAGWSGSQDTKQLRACMDTIRRTASEIIDEVDAFMAERMKERDVDRVTIYQIREGSPAAAYEFMGMEYVKKQGMEINPEHFQKVYEGKIAPEDTLEDLFIRFNGDRLPEDYTGHSLSVSDIVVIHRDGEDKAYYVDRFGYTEVPEFLAPAQEAVRSGHEEAGRSMSRNAWNSRLWGNTMTGSP